MQIRNPLFKHLITINATSKQARPPGQEYPGLTLPVCYETSL